MNSYSARQEIGELIKALAKAKTEFKPVAKTGKNSAFAGSKYARLEDIIEATQEALSNNGLVLVQTFDIGNNDIVIMTTTLYHESGQYLESRTKLKSIEGNRATNPLQEDGIARTLPG